MHEAYYPDLLQYSNMIMEHISDKSNVALDASFRWPDLAAAFLKWDEPKG